MPAGSAVAAEAASQPVGSMGPASESAVDPEAGTQRALRASMAVAESAAIPSRTGAEEEVGVKGGRMPCCPLWRYYRSGRVVDECREGLCCNCLVLEGGRDHVYGSLLRCNLVL